MTRNEAKAYRAAIEAGANAVERTDDEALAVKGIYPAWADLIGQTAEKVGFKLTHAGKLWKTMQPEYIFAKEWEPGAEGTESLFEEVCESHAGTLEDPIPYSGNMELTEGLYYSQDGVVYLCTRSTGAPVYHALKDLVGLYVEEVQG